MFKEFVWFYLSFVFKKYCKGFLSLDRICKVLSNFFFKNKLKVFQFLFLLKEFVRF